MEFIYRRAEHLRCPECGSDLIEQRDIGNTSQEALALVCRSCGAEPEWADAIVDAVDRALSSSAYERFKDSGETGPVYECPACGRQSYIDFENACAVCGEAFEYEAECIRCYNDIPLEDALNGLDEGICSYCMQVLAKDD